MDDKKGPAPRMIARVYLLRPLQMVESNIVAAWYSESYQGVESITMTFLVGTKGQITISKEIRDQLGIEPGWRAIQRLEAGHVVVEFLPPRHRRSLAGTLGDATSVRITSSEALERAAEVAWEEAALESLRPSEE